MAHFPSLVLTRPRVVSAALALCFVLLSVPTWAVDSASRGAARQLGYEGVEAYQAKDYTTAVEKLERAYRVLQVPSLALWSARALRESGEWVEASERYLEATRLDSNQAGDAKVQDRAKEEARREREALLQKIPKVVVLIQGADPESVRVTIDGVEVSSALFGAGRPTNPGDIEVVATLGERTVRGTVHLPEGEEKSITLAFKEGEGVVPVPPPVESPQAEEPPEEMTEPETPPEESDDELEDSEDDGVTTWRRPVGWAVTSVGIAGVAFGGVAGLVALALNQDLKNQCGSDKVCDPSDDHSVDSAYVNTYNTMRTVSGVGLIAGGVLLAGGITLIATSKKKNPEAARVEPYLGFASAGLRGSF